MEDFYSDHYPAQDEIRGFITSLYADTHSTLSNMGASLSKRHNTYTNYVVSFLMFGTGHRPVRDPFCYLSDIDLVDNWLLVDDKAVSEQRRFRPAALPECAKFQLELYLQYLRYLANILQPRQGAQGQLGDSVANLLASSGHSSIPLFFYLSENLSHTRSVTSKSLKRVWERHWNEPTNFGRKFIATELGKKRSDATLLRIQLGHEESVDNPLGRSSTIVPLQALVQIGTELDQILVDVGWKTLKFGRASLNRSLNMSKQRRNRRQVHESGCLGPELRFQYRKKSLQRDKAIVEEHFDRKFNGDLESLTEARVAELARLIRDDAIAQKANSGRCTYLLYRKIRRLTKRNPTRRYFQKIIAITSESSPFSRHTCRNYQALRNSRNKFVRLLSAQSKAGCKPTLEKRLAEIAVCSALFGRLCQKKLIDRLPLAVIMSTQRIHDQIFVDFIKSMAPPTTHNMRKEVSGIGADGADQRVLEKPEYRWVPDDLSLALILGLFRKKQDLGSQYDKKLLNKYKNQILGEVLDSHVKGGKRSQMLVNLAQAGALMECPGYLRAYVCGDRPHTPLSIGTLARMATGERLRGLFQQAPPEEGIDVAWRPRIGTDALSNSLELAINFKAGLRQRFTDAHKLEYKENKVRNRKLRLFLASSIPEFMESTEWPVIASALSSWVFRLCRKGTRNFANLAFSTVDSYTFMVGTPLLNDQHEVNFLDLSEEEYEEVYMRALTYANRNDVLNVAGRLREFHHHLVETWGVGDPDWSVVFLEAGNLDAGEYQADANFLTKNEYFQAIDLSLGSSEGPSLRQYQQTALLILGYRFGLRFGECYKMQLRDVQILDDDWNIVFLLVRNSIFGNLKTLAAVRHVPLPEKLTEIEKTVLSRAIKVAGEYELSDIQHAMMDQGSNSRKLVPRHELSQALSHILKFVTGDPNFRFHHLRRSWVMRITSSLIPNTIDTEHHPILGATYPEPIENPSLIWANRLLYNRLEDISKIVGHVDPDTLLSSYTHILEWFATGYRPYGKQRVTNHVWSHALGISENAVKKRRTRFGQSGRAASCPDLEKLVPGIVVGMEAADIRSFKLVPGRILREITPLLIESSLAQILNAGRIPDGLVQKLGIEQETLDSIVSNATIIEQESGYDYYQLYQLDASPSTKLVDGKRRFVQNASEASEVRAFLRANQMLMQTSAELAVVNELCRLWARGYYPGLPYLYLYDCDEIQVLNGGLVKIGVDGLHYDVLTRNQSYSKSYGDRYGDIHNIHFASRRTLSRRGIKPGPGMSGAIGVKPRMDNSNITRRSSLNRIVFIMSIYCKYANDLG